MIHIVFQAADERTLEAAIKLDEKLKGPIYQIKDDFAVGPLQNLDTEEGWNDRGNWWKSLLDASPYANQNLVGSFDDRQTVQTLKSTLDEKQYEEIWLWLGQNGHDVCGYYWLVSQLKEYQGRIMILYLNNLPFINEKGNIFYPTTLHQIPPREFLKAKKLCRKITLSEFEVDPDEWAKLCAENAMVRTLEGGKKIISQPENFYDKDILTSLTNEWQKGNRAMTTILGKMKIKTGDVFLLWRMRQLEAENKLAINGDTTKSWKDFEIKLVAAETVAADEQQ